MDFKVIKLSNIKFSYKELLDYYNQVVNDYQHLKWTVDKDFDVKTHNVADMYSWAIQSNLKDPSKPCPPYHVKEDNEVHPNNDFKVPTDLIFGFARKVIKAFPDVRQTVIAGHPPGTRIDMHVDNDEFVKIHIPIKANDKSYFKFEDESFVLEEGHAYLINTALPHGVENEGDTDRVHFIFKLHKDDIDLILNREYLLDESQFDFDVLELPNIKFNYQELADYYFKVKHDFVHLEWTLDTPCPIHGYGILSNLKNPSKPISPLSGKDSTPEDEKLPAFTNRTPLVFGFAEKVLETFDDVEELGITSHTSGSMLPPHIDKDAHLRIHFPIEVDEKSYFIFGDKKYNLQPGKAYLINTKRTHATHNQGSKTRTHLLFKIPMGRVNDIINKEYRL
jgi:aspartyl/asparaginyl beta-hydroxylase (cupin superfamily)